MGNSRFIISVFHAAVFFQRQPFVVLQGIVDVPLSGEEQVIAVPEILYPLDLVQLQIGRVYSVGNLFDELIGLGIFSWKWSRSTP